MFSKSLFSFDCHNAFFVNPYSSMVDDLDDDEFYLSITFSFEGYLITIAGYYLVFSN